MHKHPNHDQTLTELQQQLAFQEQIIDALNISLSQQQIQITRLERALELLATQMKSLRDDPSKHFDAPPADQPPPHY